MKKIFFILSCLILITSCNKDEKQPINNASMEALILTTKGKDFIIKEKDDLVKYTATKLKLKSEDLLKEVEILLTRDDIGEYYLVKGKYLDIKTDRIITFGIPFNIDSNNPNKANDEGCTMTCDPDSDCNNGCNQVIHERCKRQSCSCTTVGGKCSAGTSF
jgi:hypothetical protein